MKSRKITTAFVTGSSMMFLAASKAYAQVALPCFGKDCVSGVQGSGESTLISFLQNALNLVIGLSALVAVGILVYSGIQYILAAGDEGKVEKATKGIIYAVVGLIICFVSVLIVNFVLDQFLA